MTGYLIFGGIILAAAVVALRSSLPQRRAPGTPVFESVLPPESPADVALGAGMPPPADILPMSDLRPEPEPEPPDALPPADILPPVLPAPAPLRAVPSAPEAEPRVVHIHVAPAPAWRPRVLPSDGDGAPAEPAALLAPETKPVEAPLVDAEVVEAPPEPPAQSPAEPAAPATSAAAAALASVVRALPMRAAPPAQDILPADVVASTEAIARAEALEAIEEALGVSEVLWEEIRAEIRPKRARSTLRLVGLVSVVGLALGTMTLILFRAIALLFAGLASPGPLPTP